MLVHGRCVLPGARMWCRLYVVRLSNKRLLCPEDELSCLPITVGSGTSDEGARLGGLPPAGISPTAKTARYFATLPLTFDRQMEVSIFLAFDFDRMANASRKVLTPADDLVEVIVHGAQRRASQSDFKSELSAHPLLIHGPSPDWFVTGGEKVIESGHKIGGRPYMEQPSSSVLEQQEQMTAGGVRQFAQIGFPSGQHDAAVTGDWPFADGVFHLLVKEHARDQVEFWWFWDF